MEALKPPRAKVPIETKVRRGLTQLKGRKKKRKVVKAATSEKNS